MDADEIKVRAAIVDCEEVIRQCHQPHQQACKKQHEQLKSWLEELIKLRKEVK